MTHKLVPIEPIEGVAVETAYLTLLKMPFGELRVRAQKALAELRDLVAFARGEFPDDVQEEFERRAATTSIPADDREEVARAIKDRLFDGLEPFGARKPENSIVELQLADAAIATLQRLGWSKNAS